MAIIVCPECEGTRRGPTGSAGDCEACGGEGFTLLPPSQPKRRIQVYASPDLVSLEDVGDRQVCEDGGVVVEVEADRAQRWLAAQEAWAEVTAEALHLAYPSRRSGQES